MAGYEITFKVVLISPQCTNYENTHKCTAVKLQHLCSYVINGGINIDNIDTEYRLFKFMNKNLNKGHLNMYSLCKYNPP